MPLPVVIEVSKGVFGAIKSTAVWTTKAGFKGAQMIVTPSATVIKKGFEITLDK